MPVTYKKSTKIPVGNRKASKVHLSLAHRQMNIRQLGVDEAIYREVAKSKNAQVYLYKNISPSVIMYFFQNV
jgi:hypothetical protein